MVCATNYDSDVEIVGCDIFDDVNLLGDETTIMPPIKPLSPTNQSTLIEIIEDEQMAAPKSVSPPPPPAPVAAKEKVNQKQNAFVKPKTPPIHSWTKSAQSPGISSGSFYGNGNKTSNVKATPKKRPTATVPPSQPVRDAPIAPSPSPKTPRRPRRASAQTAMGNIRKTMELSQFDFDENENGVIELKRKHCTLSKTSEPKKPKRTKKPAPPTKWPELPVVTNKARDGKKEPRKLYPLVQDLIELGDDDATAPKTPKMVKRANNRDSIAADLTPANFRSSHYADPKKAMNRALENGNKINEHALKKDATKFNPNATFSYRNAAYENKSREPSAVVFSQADSTSPNAVSDSSF